MHSQTYGKTENLMQYSFNNYISHSEANLLANHQIPAIIMTPSGQKLHSYGIQFPTPRIQHKKTTKVM